VSRVCKADTNHMGLIVFNGEELDADTAVLCHFAFLVAVFFRIHNADTDQIL
jgi:hypothetical protein